MIRARESELRADKGEFNARGTDPRPWLSAPVCVAVLPLGETSSKTLHPSDCPVLSDLGSVGEGLPFNFSLCLQGTEVSGVWVSELGELLWGRS